MSNDTTTTNGMKTFESSLDNCVDLFFKIGASRGQNIIPQFEQAFNEDPDITLRIAQWVRDVRGGSGERQIFKDILKWMATESEMGCRALMIKTPTVGRWDDLLALVGTPLEKDAFTLIGHGLLVEKDALCAKWMPRKGDVAIKLRNFLGMTPKQYRKTLVGLTNVVESQMCAKDWDAIDFGKLPSVASARYQKAFNKNAEVAYRKFKEALTEGVETVNAGAVYPYDIIKSINNNGDDTVANAQWKNLPNYMEGVTGRILPVVDVSASMGCSASGSTSISCMDVAISLGLYISERNEGIFQDKFITFSESPELISLSGSLKQRLIDMKSSNWGYNTNIAKVFDLVLNSGITHSVPNDEMPNKILILSDMQFDSAKQDSTIMDTIIRKYEDAGYDVPDIVFWNIRDVGTVPVEFNTDGVALVSGFSPAIMKSVIACEKLTPIDIMKDAVNIERYDWC